MGNSRCGKFKKGFLNDFGRVLLINQKKSIGDGAKSNKINLLGDRTGEMKF
jgi:hypothetical protein